MRPIWKGFITFGLVNIPVILYPAEKRFDIHFKLLDSRDHARIRYMRVNEQTGEEVPWNEIAKGYEYDKNNYVILKDAEMKAMIEEHTKSINIECFVKQDSLDYIAFEKPYYIVPDTKGEKGYVILRETLKAAKVVGLARIVIHTRGYLCALMPWENALIINLLRYPQELRKPSEYELPSESIKTYKISSKELEIARQLVNTMTAKWNPLDFHDTFRENLQHWIEEQIQKTETKATRKRTSRTKAADNVINFVDVLRKSLKERQATKPATKKRPKSRGNQ